MNRFLALSLCLALILLSSLSYAIEDKVEDYDAEGEENTPFYSSLIDILAEDLGSESPPKNSGWWKLLFGCPNRCANGACGFLGYCKQGCKDKHYWGLFCNKKCSSNCKNNECSQNGDCFACNGNRYGSCCERLCSPSCLGGPESEPSCDKKTGTCTYGCSNPQMWGDSCDIKCPTNCLPDGTGRSCNQKNGNCNKCEKGKWGAQCENTCPSTCESCSINNGACESCIAGHWGPMCESNCMCNSGCENLCEKESGTCLCGRSCNNTCNALCFSNTCTNGDCNCMCDPSASPPAFCRNECHLDIGCNRELADKFSNACMACWLNPSVDECAPCSISLRNTPCCTCFIPRDFRYMC